MQGDKGLKHYHSHAQNARPSNVLKIDNLGEDPLFKSYSSKGSSLQSVHLNLDLTPPRHVPSGGKQDLWPT